MVVGETDVFGAVLACEFHPGALEGQLAHGLIEIDDYVRLDADDFVRDEADGGGELRIEQQPLGHRPEHVRALVVLAQDEVDGLESLDWNPGLPGEVLGESPFLADPGQHLHDFVAVPEEGLLQGQGFRDVPAPFALDDKEKFHAFV